VKKEPNHPEGVKGGCGRRKVDRKVWDNLHTGKPAILMDGGSNQGRQGLNILSKGSDYKKKFVNLKRKNPRGVPAHTR